LEQLEEDLNSKAKAVNIRLREGEYQFSLAKTIASFELELCFPDVKDLVKKLFGEKKTEDPQFLSKIQTILKKMEKSGVIKILPKEKPWELQRYVLTSFRFQDVDKNQIILVTESDIKRTLNLINSQLSPNSLPMPLKPSYAIARIWILAFAMIISYATILWTLTQPTINLVIFVSAFCIATICSILLGVAISRRK
jgi:hypothetical protein